MAAARSRHDVARMLRANNNPPAPVDESFVAVLAAQARLLPSTSAATSPRRTLMLAGAAAAVVTSTVGVAVAANQGLFVSPDPQRTPPATAPSDTSAPRPVDEEDPDEQQENDRLGRAHGSEESAPQDDRENAPEPTGNASTSTPAGDRPAKPGGETTKGADDGQDGEDGPRGDGSSEDEPGNDDRDADEGDEGDSEEDDGRDGDDPEESESPDPEESESPEPAEPDEPESDDGSDSAGATEPDRDSLTG